MENTNKKTTNFENTEKYDEKYILKKLFEGTTREELAKEFKHKSYRTLDMYMRRRGYFWDNERQIYATKSKNNITEAYEDMVNGKVQRIISSFNMNMEPMDIAKKVGIKDHKTMAMYMRSKGYTWCPDKKNYILHKGIINREETISNKTQPGEESNELIGIENYYEEESSMEKFEGMLPMLEMINKNKDRLAELLSINSYGTIPRYVIGGISITKSICMSHFLSELIKEFSKEKNLSQREIFEIAIIEFLMKYGFANEVNALFQEE